MPVGIIGVPTYQTGIEVTVPVGLTLNVIGPEPTHAVTEFVANPPDKVGGVGDGLTTTDTVAV